MNIIHPPYTLIHKKKSPRNTHSKKMMWMKYHKKVFFKKTKNKKHPLSYDSLAETQVPK